MIASAGLDESAERQLVDRIARETTENESGFASQNVKAHLETYFKLSPTKAKQDSSDGTATHAMYGWGSQNNSGKGSGHPKSTATTPFSPPGRAGAKWCKYHEKYCSHTSYECSLNPANKGKKGAGKHQHPPCSRSAARSLVAKTEPSA
ncbi:unnamed protein product [Amoebophrya sp. A120]|nr:unnamed protein product [Amoebophrya sp. A120]|eukprot:GSA120T00016899001.1